MQTLEQIFIQFGDISWGPHLLILLIGGGFFFLIYSKLAPFRFFKHAIDITRGKYIDPNAPGEITPFQALTSALAATVGMGNISGVAVAIVMGGPGALFWMWVSAFVGMATKFFTCTLSVMYRGKDSAGKIQGGPMYVIMEGLGKKWKPLAVVFALAGLFGPLPIFQANQLTQILRDVLLKSNGINLPSFFWTNLVTGLIISIIVSFVIFGGLKRIANVASKMVPAMVVIYVVAVISILMQHVSEIPAMFALILNDAFTGNSVMGGSVGALIVVGFKRAAFSNEAGVGTESLAHGAAQNNEPVQEGLVAMFEPFIDTIVVCTMTALAILATGVWQSTEANGVTLTLNAFRTAFPDWGTAILLTCVLFFSFSSLFTYSYYGTKCFGFLVGADKQWMFNYFYVVSIIFGAVATIQSIVSLIDGMYATMAIPTMISALLLAPKVKAAMNDYFARIEG